MLPFVVTATDSASRARRGVLTTAHGRVDTPTFMPVGTRAAVPALDPAELTSLGAQMILANTYHLMLRPGPEQFRRVGGIGAFMRWPGSVLTDSGGYQIFSLENCRTLTEEGARFRSYVDQRVHLLSPERSIEVQSAIGSDIMMVLDECIDSTAEPALVRAAMDRTHRWALRSLQAQRDLTARGESKGALFAIVQGGVSAELRRESAAFLTQHEFDGFAIGGLAVGDTRTDREQTTALAAELLPAGRPRYLMGVGTPPDLLWAMLQGVDLFDCILPSHHARQATAFTGTGRVKITRACYTESDEPLDAQCQCSTCARFSRAYLRHLFQCGEALATRLVSLHNMHHYLTLMAEARRAIAAGTFTAYVQRKLEVIDRHEHSGRRIGAEAGIAATVTRELVTPEPVTPEPGTPEAGTPGVTLRVVPVGAVPPGALAPGATLDCEVVQTRDGAPAIFDRATGEVMHRTGPQNEAQQLYVGPAKLAERLREATAMPLVLLDIGLGAASNALAAWRCSEALVGARRQLQIISLDRSAAALELALRPEHANAFGLVEEGASSAARGLLATGRHETPQTRWELHLGEIQSVLPSLGAAFADVVFWDPFSPRVNPELWTYGALLAARHACRDGATLHTYSGATSVRSALLLAGFTVGTGLLISAGKTATCAATSAQLVTQPLDRRWLERLRRSGAPFPADAPRDALERIAALPQFAIV
ncbi:MAG: hypothetical protein RL033_3559 [Pseudomonadota bacterium]